MKTIILISESIFLVFGSVFQLWLELLNSKIESIFFYWLLEGFLPEKSKMLSDVVDQLYGIGVKGEISFRLSNYILIELVSQISSERKQSIKMQVDFRPLMRRKFPP